MVPDGLLNPLLKPRRLQVYTMYQSIAGHIPIDISHGVLQHDAIRANPGTSSFLVHVGRAYEALHPDAAYSKYSVGSQQSIRGAVLEGRRTL